MQKINVSIVIHYKDGKKFRMIEQYSSSKDLKPVVEYLSKYSHVDYVEIENIW